MTSGPVGLIIAAAFVLVIIIIILKSIKLKNEIKNNGIQADATVSRIEEFHDEDGVRYTTHVVYRNQEGKEVEAILATSKRQVQEGEKILIKYLDKKPNFVVLVEE